MKTEYLRALASGRTYSPGNPWLWMGLLWSLPVLSAGLLGPWLFLLYAPLSAALLGAAGVLFEEEKERAAKDPLTGLYNRRFVLEALSQAISRAERSRHPVSVVLFDLDRFKAVNERYGHQEGDRVLREAARALAGVVRRGDVLGRYGGDEFLLVLPDRLDEVAEFTERASEAVHVHSGVSISAGVAHWPQDGRSPAELLRTADLALAIAKRMHHECESAARR